MFKRNIILDECFDEIQPVPIQQPINEAQRMEVDQRVEEGLPGPPKKSPWDHFDQKAAKVATFNPEDLLQDELQRYLAAELLNRNECPFKWWKNNQVKFPRVARAAKKYLAIPATEVSSERLFSTAGNVVTHRRSLLSTEHVEQMTFLHDFVQHEYKGLFDVGK